MLGKCLRDASDRTICHQRHSFYFQVVIPYEVDVRDEAREAFPTRERLRLDKHSMRDHPAGRL